MESESRNRRGGAAGKSAGLHQNVPDPRGRWCRLHRGVMTEKPFLKSGHVPTLISALLYFDVSFMVWVILGPLAPFLRQQFGLSATAQGLLVAVPLLGGSLFRPILGVLADRIGG